MGTGSTTPRLPPRGPGPERLRKRMRRIGLLLTVLTALAGCGENAATAQHRPGGPTAPGPGRRRTRAGRRHDRRCADDSTRPAPRRTPTSPGAPATRPRALRERPLVPPRPRLRAGRAVLRPRSSRSIPATTRSSTSSDTAGSISATSPAPPRIKAQARRRERLAAPLGVSPSRRAARGHRPHRPRNQAPSRPSRSRTRSCLGRRRSREVPPKLGDIALARGDAEAAHKIGSARSRSTRTSTAHPQPRRAPPGPRGGGQSPARTLRADGRGPTAHRTREAGVVVLSRLGPWPWR